LAFFDPQGDAPQDEDDIAVDDLDVVDGEHKSVLPSWNG
jgi:hypothetical protein